MGSMGSPNAVNFGGLAWPKTSEEIGKPMENPEFFFFLRGSIELKFDGVKHLNRFFRQSAENFRRSRAGCCTRTGAGGCFEAG